jgi:hypothetical protein
MDGEFLLASYEKNYEDYLIGMGMPGFVAKLILSAKEVITYTEPKESDGLWTIFTKTGESLVVGVRRLFKRGHKHATLKTTKKSVCFFKKS